jgi:hypothetical protein
MFSLSRPVAAFCVALLLFALQANTSRTKAGGAPAPPPDRPTYRNEYGAVIRDAAGRRITYTKAEIEEQARNAPPAAAPGPGGAPAGAPPCSGFDADQAWSYATFGSGIGLSNIKVAQNGSHPEVYVGIAADLYWTALRRNAETGEYEGFFVSPAYAAPVSRIEVADVAGDSADEIVVALDNGEVHLYDKATKAALGTMSTSVSGVTGLGIANVDGDGANEIILCTLSFVAVFSWDEGFEWEVPGAGGYELVVAQMDADAALEVAVTSGRVIDCTAHAVQWTWAAGFGRHVVAGDVDGDGLDELIGAEPWYFVYAYDVDRQLPKWSISAELDIAAIQMADMDGDSAPELLLGDGQWGDVRAYDGATQAVEGVINNPAHGVTNIGVGDADGDGDLDVLWGAGYSSSGRDYLYVADWTAKRIDWENIHLDGPFIGPRVGDLDGDGRRELVVASTESDSGYGSGRILVFDARTRHLRAISPEIVGGSSWEGLNDVRLRDLDGDGRQEILVAADRLYDGVIEIYSFSAADQFTMIWTNTTQPDGSPFESVDAADIDGDGVVEIVGGVGYAHTGSDGTFVYAYSFATGAEEWHSLHLGGFGTVSGLELADVDADGALEILATRVGANTYIFDGPTKELEAILFGPFTTLRVRATGAAPVIVQGNSSGELVEYSHTTEPGVPYIETSRQTVVAGSIGGLTYDAQGRRWVGSAGVVTVVDPQGACLWSRSGYGGRFGTDMAFLPGSRTFFGAGQHLIAAFASGTGFGRHTAGVFDPSTSGWLLHNENGPGSADLVFTYGPSGAGFVPLSGDWDGDGVDTPGLYDPATGAFFLRDENAPGGADLVFTFGAADEGFTPVVGDWNGDGVDSIGLYAPATGAFFLRNRNAPGPADLVFTYGPSGAGYAPLSGDWDGDGVDTVGLYASATGAFFLRNQNAPGGADVVFTYGPGGAVPLVGDWDADGGDSVGVYLPSTAAWFLRNANSPGGADLVFSYGPTGVVPMIGDWDGE